MNKVGCVFALGMIFISRSVSLYATEALPKTQRPNIVWIMAEDMSTELSCYDHPGVRTPHLDGLACQGARYTHAFCPAPSCTPSRNAMMTGVIFIGDNGRCHLRGKCWLYDPGIRVPLILRWPDHVAPGAVHENMVSMIDISATVLDMAGVALPPRLDGHPILGPRVRQRDHIFAARDLIDEVMDHIRCVRTPRFKYIRNDKPENGYRECLYVQNNRPMLQVIRDLGTQGKLTEAQRLILAETKPQEELYDLLEDPHEVHNLAASPDHRAIRRELRSLLNNWIADTEDKGFLKMESSS